MPVKPTPDYLRECLDYDPETGVLNWKARPRHHFEKERNWKAWLARFEGKRTGSRSVHGYLLLAINNKSYSAHRLAWALATGRWPHGEVDHVNGDRSDNRWANLRDSTRAENSRNAKLHVDSSSGVKGVTLDPRKAKWRARVFLLGKEHYLGVFTDKAEATTAVRKLREELHGEFAHHGVTGNPPPLSPVAAVIVDDFEV